MEFVEGQSLDQIIGPHGLPPERVATILRQICLGLEAAHEQGVVHRDLKPQNIMIELAGPGCRHGFRAGIHRRGRRPHAPRRVARNARLYVAGAGSRTETRPAFGYLFAGNHRVRDAYGQGAIPIGNGDRVARGAHQGKGAGAARDQRDAFRRASAESSINASRQTRPNDTKRQGNAGGPGTCISGPGGAAGHAFRTSVFATSVGRGRLLRRARIESAEITAPIVTPRLAPNPVRRLEVDRRRREHRGRAAGRAVFCFLVASRRRPGPSRP